MPTIKSTPTSGFQFFQREHLGQRFPRSVLPQGVVTVGPQFTADKKNYLSVQPDISAEQQIIPVVTTIALDATTGDTEFLVTGNVLLFNFATDSTVVVNCKLHDKKNSSFFVGKNFFLAGIYFKKIYLSWTTQPAKTIQFMVMNDPSKLQNIRIQ